MKIFGPCSFSNACHLHRIVYPFRYLSVDAPQHEWQTGLTDPSGPYDCLWIYGSQPLSNFPEIATKKRNGTKIVWATDDSYHDWPTWRHDAPSPEIVGCVDLAAEIADLIVVSTPTLAAEIGKFDRTIVCPNLIDVSAYHLSTPPADDGPVRILWSGSATHKGDCDRVDEACCRIKAKWGDRVEFHLFGAGPDKLLRQYWNKGVRLTDWVPLSQYWWHLHNARPHVTLAPLADCHFNRSKSNIRVLEGWAMNSACVASPVGEYTIGRARTDALFADTPDQWFDAMDALIADRTLRERLATNGYRRVTDDWDWNSETAREKWQPLLSKLDEWDALKP